MPKLLIAEKEERKCRILENAIREKYPNWYIDWETDINSAINKLRMSFGNHEKYSLFLINIQMGDHEKNREGFLLAEQIRSCSEYYCTPILFLSSIKEEVYHALFRYHCYNYIFEPYSPSDILEQMESLFEEGYLKKIITVHDINRIIYKINRSEIYTVESFSHTIHLYLSNHSCIHTREYGLGEFLKILGSEFLQCHRRYLINLSYFLHYDKTSQYIKVGERNVPVGRRYRNMLEGRLGISKRM